MINVHMIERDNANQDWVGRALRSIPTDLCVIKHRLAKGRPICENRIRCFKLGTEPYVSSVDDDDYVLPGAFEACYEFLEANPEYAAVGTREKKVRIDGTVVEKDISGYFEEDAWKAIHHIVVFRREVLMPFLHVMEGQRRPEPTLFKAMDKAGLKAKILDFVGYVWIRHKDSLIYTGK